MEPDLVVFDIAGTTLHDSDFVLDGFREALAAYRIRPSREAILAVMGLAKPEAVRRLLTAELGDAAPHPSLVERVLTRLEARCLERYRYEDDVREVEGASDVFAILHARGARVALDTGFSRPIAEAILARTRWVGMGLVDAVVTRSEVPRGRPAPDMILEIQRRLGLRAPRLAKIGDTPADLQEGAAAGACWNIGVTFGTTPRARLELEPHTHLVSRLLEIPAILETVPERQVRVLRTPRA